MSMTHLPPDIESIGPHAALPPEEFARIEEERRFFRVFGATLQAAFAPPRDVPTGPTLRERVAELEARVAALEARGAPVTLTPDVDNDVPGDLTLMETGDSADLAAVLYDVTDLPAVPAEPVSEPPPVDLPSGTDGGDAPQSDMLREAWLSGQVTPAQMVQHIEAGEVEPPPARPGLIIQTKQAELSLRVDLLAQDRIEARAPAGRAAELEAIMADVERKTARGEMLTDDELAAEAEFYAGSAFRTATLNHAASLKDAILRASSAEIEDIEASIEEGWPDGVE